MMLLSIAAVNGMVAATLATFAGDEDRTETAMHDRLIWNSPSQSSGRTVQPRLLT